MLIRSTFLFKLALQREESMALNFKINSRRNNGKLFLKITGDFDGSSAFELIDTLQAHNGKVEKIIIDTDGLCSIHPWGLNVFQKNFSIKKLSCDLRITGKHADSIALQKRYSL